VWIISITSRFRSGPHGPRNARLVMPGTSLAHLPVSRWAPVKDTIVLAARNDLKKEDEDENRVAFSQ